MADGAGSAPYSREGSRIACNVAVDHCKGQLADSENFDDDINLYHLDQKSEAAGKAISADIYKIVGNAALKAHKAIAAEAQQKGRKTKEYSTTLLLAICKNMILVGLLPHSGSAMGRYVFTTKIMKLR